METIGKFKIKASLDNNELYCKGYVTLNGITEYCLFILNKNKSGKNDADFILIKNDKLRSRIPTPAERNKRDCLDIPLVKIHNCSKILPNQIVYKLYTFW